MRERADWNWAPALRGQYSDALDRSQSVTGTLTSPTFAIVVDFGDAKLNVNGTVVEARAAQGAIFTCAPGNRQFPLTMTRWLERGQGARSHCLECLLHAVFSVKVTRRSGSRKRRPEHQGAPECGPSERR